MQGNPNEITNLPITWYLYKILHKSFNWLVLSEVDVSSLGHGYFAECEYLLEDIGGLLTNNQPSQQRDLATFQGQPYWRMRYTK